MSPLSLRSSEIGVPEVEESDMFMVSSELSSIKDGSVIVIVGELPILY